MSGPTSSLQGHCQGLSKQGETVNEGSKVRGGEGSATDSVPFITRFQCDLFSLTLHCKPSNTITYKFKFRFLLFLI